MKYRSDIDGLRAIAVLPVMLYHAGVGVGGGFVGVDVFFVISGYLITGILWRELEEARYSVVAFYERRVRRIFPARNRLNRMVCDPDFIQSRFNQLLHPGECDVVAIGCNFNAAPRKSSLQSCYSSEQSRIQHRLV